MIKHSRKPLLAWKTSKNYTHFIKCRKIVPNCVSKTVSKWEAVIGLEIHAQISSKTKLFSGARARYGSAPNCDVTFLDASLPGTLPRLNRSCVKAAVLTALALKSSVNLVSKFDRKHYFYADLPVGYQITQQRQPIARGGHLRYVDPHAGDSQVAEKSVRITQLQLEQDSGKSLHDAEGGESLIDLNRAGCALMEIVTEPDLRTPEEAHSFVRELRNLLIQLGTCDGKMDEGNLRVDASVSLHEPGTPLGTRAEIKNLNSLRQIQKAIEFEIKRQTALLDADRAIDNETRAFDVEQNITYALRDKEKLHDYRFLAEPNLPPLHLYTNQTIPKDLPSSQVVNVDELADTLPTLPHEQRRALLQLTGLRPQDVLDIVDTPGVYKLFTDIRTARPSQDVRVINMLLQFLMAAYNGENLCFLDSPVKSCDICQLLDFIEENRLTRSSAKKILRTLCHSHIDDVSEHIASNNMWKITDAHEIHSICAHIIGDHKATKYVLKKKQRERVMRELVKQVRDATNGRIEPTDITDTINKMLL